jgi:hypothetical protein
MVQALCSTFSRLCSDSVEPLPARFEKPEPVHRFTGKISLEPGNHPVNVNRATALAIRGREPKSASKKRPNLSASLNIVGHGYTMLF